MTPWLLSLELVLSYPGFTDDISSLEVAIPIHNRLSMQVVLYKFEIFYDSNHELKIAVADVEIIKDITTRKFLVHDWCHRRAMAFDLCWVQLWHDKSSLSFSCMKLVFHVNVHESIMRHFLNLPLRSFHGRFMKQNQLWRKLCRLKQGCLSILTFQFLVLLEDWKNKRAPISLRRQFQRSLRMMYKWLSWYGALGLQFLVFDFIGVKVSCISNSFLFFGGGSLGLFICISSNFLGI